MGISDTDIDGRATVTYSRGWQSLVAMRSLGTRRVEEDPYLIGHAGFRGWPTTQ